MSVLQCFKMPNPVKITGRISTITNSFVNGIIPVIPPTEEDVIEALRILHLDADDLRCAYCGDVSTEWDHLRPLVKDKLPTGYISEIANLVPACGKCNQSKGNKLWREWIFSDAKLSPKTKKVIDLNERVARLETYEQWRDVQQIDFAELVGEDKWSVYWDSLQTVVNAMRDSQLLADEIKDIISSRK